MLRSLFVVAVMVPGVYFALRNRFAALLLYIWFGLFRPQDWLWIDVTSLRLSLMFGAILILPSFLGGIWPNITHPLSIGTFAFLLTGLIAQFGAIDPELGWQWFDFQARLTLISLMTVSLITTRQRLLLVVAVVGGSLGFHAAKAGLASALGGGVRFYDGLAGAFPDNNGYALATVMIMPMLLVTAQNLVEDRYKWIRRGFYASVALCGITVVSTFSRGGFLALAVAVLTYIMLQRRRLVVLLGLGVLAGVAYLAVPIPQGYLDRLETIRTYEKVDDESALSRLHFWRVAMVMADNHVFGVGLRNYEAAYNQYDFSYGLYGVHRSVHSSHFQVLAELGFPGAFIWMLMFALAFALALRVRRRSRHPDLTSEERRFYFTMANALMVSMAGFIVGGAFVASALNDLTWMTFAMVASLDRLAHQPVALPVLAPATRLVQRLS
jgi:probable O-glycosylation ligase (exosortase A-associated)